MSRTRYYFDRRKWTISKVVGYGATEATGLCRSGFGLHWGSFKVPTMAVLLATRKDGETFRVACPYRRP